MGFAFFLLNEKFMHFFTTDKFFYPPVDAEKRMKQRKVPVKKNGHTNSFMGFSLKSNTEYLD